MRLGYRADYIYRLARQFADGELSGSDFQDSAIPAEEVRKQLLALKGIGGYAAASMLMLLGRYDHIPVDTVFRQFMAEKYLLTCPAICPKPWRFMRIGAGGSTWLTGLTCSILKVRPGPDSQLFFGCKLL